MTTSRRRRRALLAGVGVLALIAFAVVLQAVDEGDGFGLLDGEGSTAWQYASVFLLVAADAVVPVFPSESTLNAASTMAADGVLSLWVVIALGALGAIVGDSALYWIARLGGSRMQSRLDSAKRNRKVADALELLGRSAPLLIVCGRYVPGLRFVVNATMGLAGYPYRRFLLWDAIGAVTWSLYTCLLAYSIGSVLEDYPLASIAISGAVTSAILVAAFFVVRRREGASRRARAS